MKDTAVGTWGQSEVFLTAHTGLLEEPQRGYVSPQQAPSVEELATMQGDCPMASKQLILLS